MTDRPTLITLHHLAGSGGTIIAKSLAAMSDVLVLSEIHPDRHLRGQFHPLVQLQDGYGELLDDEDRARIDEHFVAEIALGRDIAARHGCQLIVRDHAYRDFTELGRSRSRLVDLLERTFDLRKIVSFRDPVDSFLSHRAQKVSDGTTWFDGTPEEFCERMLRFADAFADAVVFRYEDFVVRPVAVMESVCLQAGIGFRPDFQDRIGTFRHFTGDSGRRGDTIESRPRRSLDPVLADEFASSRSYRLACERFGYEPVGDADAEPAAVAAAG